MKYAKRTEVKITLRYKDSNINAPMLLKDITSIQEKINEVLPMFKVEDCVIYLQEFDDEKCDQPFCC